MADDKRLVEDYLPIEAISVEASVEPRTKGHISTLQIWRARRPLVACRAAVYGALVPQSQFVPIGGRDAQRRSLGRANAKKLIKALCQSAITAEKGSSLVCEMWALLEGVRESRRRGWRGRSEWNMAERSTT